MRIAKGIFFTVSLLVVGLGVEVWAASESDLAVQLQRIEKIKSQEKSGDELYISVTEFPKDGTPKHYQIPSFPTHWLSEHLSSIKDVTLWERSSKGCADNKVVFSLVEEDIPPWNLNDLIGSVVLEMKCENGKQSHTWTIPNPSVTEPVEGVKDAFIFKGDNARYQAFFGFSKNKK